MKSPDASVTALLITLTLLVLSAAIKPFFDGARRRAAIAGIGALILLLAAFFWDRLVGPTLAASIRDVASNAWVWLGLFLLMWGYSTYRDFLIVRQRDHAIALVEDRIQPIILALDRFVLPRELRADQIKAIADSLRRELPAVATFVVQKHDAEAGQFAEDISMALREGGWTVATTRYEDVQQEDWHMVYEMSDEETQRSRTTRVRLPIQTLYDAFKAIGVEADAGSGGGADNVASKLTITIGRRRRDRHAIRPARYR